MESRVALFLNREIDWETARAVLEEYAFADRTGVDQVVVLLSDLARALPGR